VNRVFAVIIPLKTLSRDNTPYRIGNYKRSGLHLCSPT